MSQPGVPVSSSSPAPRPLFVFHTPSACPGLLGDSVTRIFGGFDEFRASAGAPFPDPDTLTGPVVLFGGPMGLADAPALPWMRAEIHWVQQLIARNHRLLGICLGAQLIAHVLGQQIISCEQGGMECGYYPLHSQGHWPLPTYAYQWHRNGIALDPDRRDIVCLARSPWQGERTTQAFLCGNSMGLQFHPEATPTTIARWLARDPQDLSCPGARPAETHLPDHERYRAEVSAWLDQCLVEGWLAAPSSPPARACA